MSCTPPAMFGREEGGKKTEIFPATKSHFSPPIGMPQRPLEFSDPSFLTPYNPA